MLFKVRGWWLGHIVAALLNLRREESVRELSTVA